MGIIISAENVEFNYRQNQSGTVGYTALRDVNLRIKEGEYVVVIGRNGSGKSTFARLLNALIIPQKGTIHINNLQVNEEENLWEIRQTVGMVFQNPDNQIVATSVEEDVAFGPENLGMDPDEICTRVDEALGRVGLLEYRNSAPHNLSGGQKQRVAIAGILAMKPKCIVLDEATSMLDPIGRKEVLSVIAELNSKKKITVINITHHMEEAALADRVLVIHEGSIVMDGKPSEIFSRVEEIKSFGLDVPQISELFYELTREGYEFPSGILDIDSALYYIKEYMKR
ncbi:MAG: energy-coupling factor transporter ATPase [Clostridiaceae bacterium]|nr:energy-coupling factor transporter ATPase [Clostridiaceae bacterium]